MPGDNAIATIDSLDVIRAIMDEREQRYTDRHNASQLALSAAFVAQEKAFMAAMLSAEKQVMAALSSADRAVQKAEIAAERRFESVNEFRSTLADQQVQLITRNEVNAKLDALTSKIEMGLAATSKEAQVTISRLDRMEGKSAPRSESDNQFINHEERISTVTSRLDRIEGKSGGVGYLASAIVAGMGLVIAVASVVVQVMR